ncbi:MAG: hypothetical protein ACJ786_25330, partial [Catenulispora sp.]
MASALTRKNQTTFYLENLTLSWFPHQRQQRLARLGVFLTTALFVGLVAGLGAKLVYGLVATLFVGLAAALLTGLSVLFGLLGAAEPTEEIRFRRT